MTHSLEQCWQSVLGQLKIEMPKASFDSWVRDTHVVSFEDGILKIGIYNQYARDWLESRLTSSVSRMLVGIMNQSVIVEFVVEPRDNDEEKVDPGGEEDAGGEADVQVVNRLRYDEIVAPSKIVAIPGYFSRLIPEIGARNAWLYVGWRQAVWSGEKRNESAPRSRRIPVKNIIRYSGLSKRTFFRAIGEETTWKALEGLVERQDVSPRWAQGRDRRSHRLPNGYTVHMTIRLARADSVAIFEWLGERIKVGMTLMDALKLALGLKDLVGELLHPIGEVPQSESVPIKSQTVMDIASALNRTDGDLPIELQEAAEALHHKIISAFGTILIPHYFLETVIPQTGLTPPQAWLVTLLRDRCYVNPQTGEVRDEVLVRGGYVALANWLGLSRPKTIWEWMRDLKGAVSGFVLILPLRTQDEADTLRLRARLDEPLFDGANGTHDVANVATMNGGNDTLNDGADGTHNLAQMAPMDGGVGTNDWREWHGLKHLTTSSNTHPDYITTSADTAEVVPTAWSLRRLLVQNRAHPRVTKELLAANASIRAFVSWLLFACSPAGEGINNPFAYAIASLQENAHLGAGGSYDTLASLSRSELTTLIHSSAKTSPRKYGFGDDPPGTRLWDETMGSSPRHAILLKILLGDYDTKE